MNFYRHTLGAIVLLAGAAASQPAAAIFIDGQFAGQWAEAGTPGVRRGLNLQYFKLGPEQGTLFAVGFFFDNAGNQIWISGNALVTPGLFEFTFPVSLITGGRFAGGPAGEIVQVQNFAQVTLTVNSCNSLDFAWQWSGNGGPDIGTGSVNMDRGVSTVGAPGFAGPERCVYQKEFTGCPAFATDLGDRSCLISAPASSPLTGEIDLSNDITWFLDGQVFAGGDNTNPARVNIEAGTRIIGASGNGALFIRRGSKIFAEGKPFAPVVFTGLDQQIAGEWSGVVISGNAIVNGCAEGTPIGQCEVSSEFAEAEFYGGDNDEDDSGVMRYVNIRFAGRVVFENRELNGLTLQGVGSKTILENIHIHAGLDDGIEFFGGAAQVRNLVVTEAQDDSIDWGFGFHGKIQNALVIVNNGEHGIEADNSEPPNLDLLPRANPTLSNLTMIGSSNSGEGARLRRGTGALIQNSVFTGFAGECINIDDDSTFNVAGTPPNFNDGLLQMRHTVVNCNTNFEDKDTDQFLVSTWFNAQEGNQVANPMLVGFLPANGSPLLDGGAPIEGDSFFTGADYIGGFRNGNPGANWTLGWTEFLEQ